MDTGQHVDYVSISKTGKLQSEYDEEETFLIIEDILFTMKRMKTIQYSSNASHSCRLIFHADYFYHSLRIIPT